MPYRHWYAVVNVDGQEQQRLGPYATRRTAERKARERSAGRDAAVEIVYEHTPPKPGPARR